MIDPTIKITVSHEQCSVRVEGDSNVLRVLVKGGFMERLIFLFKGELNMRFYSGEDLNIK